MFTAKKKHRYNAPHVTGPAPCDSCVAKTCPEYAGPVCACGACKGGANRSAAHARRPNVLEDNDRANASLVLGSVLDDYNEAKMR